MRFGTTFGGAVAMFLIYMYREEIKKAITYAVNACVDYSYSQLNIDIKVCPKCFFAIKEELNNIKRNSSNVNDGIKKPNYSIANGKYTIEYFNKNIKISITDDKINMSVFWKESDFLQDFMDGLYEKYCSPDKVIVFYSLHNSKWNYPIFRRTRELKNIRQTSYMTKVLDNVSIFLKNEDKYKEMGIPYRKGYLLEGPTGIGKSTIIEIIAMKHNMSVYLVHLNALNMTDALLIHLISKIPPCSIIVIEEIEKQLETLKKNRNNMVSEGGILTALDGPQRLSHGSVIIMTANSSDKLSDEFKTPLLRRGRIDSHFILKRRKKIKDNVNKKKSNDGNFFTKLANSIWMGLKKNKEYYKIVITLVLLFCNDTNAFIIK